MRIRPWSCCTHADGVHVVWRRDFRNGAPQDCRWKSASRRAPHKGDDMATTTATVDRAALEAKVKSMYSDVAANPHGEFHFEMGRVMAERLGTIGYLKAYIEDTGLAA